MKFSRLVTTRTGAVAGLLSAALLADPVAPALAQSSTATHRAATQTQTVDQRITALHSELKITPAEESDWQAVAQTMRDNAEAMRKLAAEKSSDTKQGMTALEDLQTYQEFAQAHVDGLKHLTATFTTLYNSMPDPQKKLADQVFQNARRQEPSRPS